MERPYAFQQLVRKGFLESIPGETGVGGTGRGVVRVAHVDPGGWGEPLTRHPCIHGASPLAKGNGCMMAEMQGSAWF